MPNIFFPIIFDKIIDQIWIENTEMANKTKKKKTQLILDPTADVFLKPLKVAICSLHLWRAASELTCDNCRLNIWHKHEDT